MENLSSMWVYKLNFWQKLNRITDFEAYVLSWFFEVQFCAFHLQSQIKFHRTWTFGLLTIKQCTCIKISSPNHLIIFSSKYYKNLVQTNVYQTLFISTNRNTSDLNHFYRLKEKITRLTIFHRLPNYSSPLALSVLPPRTTPWGVYRKWSRQRTGD